MIEAEIQEHRERVAPYMRFHYAFGGGGDPTEEGLSEWDIESIWEWSGRYQPARDIDLERNRWGLDVWRYLFLLFYKNETGIMLSWDLVMDFYSEEFEPDGSLRLYNNGKHPEIEAFVTWMWEGRRREDAWAFAERIAQLHSNYVRAHRDEGFERLPFYSLSMQMLDALARAYADPDYVLDLTSLQQAGY